MTGTLDQEDGANVSDGRMGPPPGTTEKTRRGGWEDMEPLLPLGEGFACCELGSPKACRRKKSPVAQRESFGEDAVRRVDEHGGPGMLPRTR